MASGYRGFSELSVRVGEFTAVPEGVSRAYVIENEVTYLAFPIPPGAMVILGGGYALPFLPLGWLSDLNVGHWGDVNTHGFAIPNRLRQHLPNARSMLMDRATLLSHREHWTTEPSPGRCCPGPPQLGRVGSLRRPHLRCHAPAVRLEQERISFSAIEKAAADG